MIDQDEKKRRDRSPAFPYISLKESLDRLERFIAHYNKHPARVSNVAAVWGFSPASSSFVRNVASLRMFGLVDDIGSGEDKKIVASALGARIISDKRPGAREEGLRKAFENCDILMHYYRRWGKPRPPEHECISELTLDSNFTQEAARKFVSVYDESLSFAGYQPLPSLPSSPQELGAGDQDELPSEYGGSDSMPSPRPAAEAQPPIQPAPENSPSGPKMKHATYPLKEGNCTLTWPSDMSYKSAKKLQRWLELMLEDVTDTDDESNDDL